MSGFVHLHTHSHYTLLAALPKIPALVKRAKELKMPALALTDAGNLYGAIDFYKACQKEEIKPIIGVDLYVAIRSRHDKQAGVDNRRYRLVLLAKNLNGYRNLLKLVSRSYLEGFYYKPRVDLELLSEYKDDLIAILPSFSSPVASALKNHDHEEAKASLKRYRDLYGQENVYLEITHHPEINGHSDLQESLKRLAKETETPLVAAHDVYYLHPEDKPARTTLLSVQSGTDSREYRNDSDGSEDFSFVGEKEMKSWFADVPEAIENTVKIADECNLELELGTWTFPDLKLDTDRTFDDELRRRALLGLEEFGFGDNQEAKERLEYELDVIKNKGFSVYFLIVADLLNYARTHGIYSTIRGSVAGSLTTYVCGITKVNPLEYRLPFERFLNPLRPSAPDIDMDFADNRRDEMIEYARQKYGAEKVAQIGTFGTMAARGSIRDVTRALGYAFDTGDKIAKLIPMGSQGFPMTIERAMKAEPELKALYENDEEVQEIMDMAMKIEGSARHIGVHAAGVVISPTEITDFVPIQLDQKTGKLITQYDMRSVEEAGLIKFDFLGLKNLAILSDAVERVKRHYGEEIDVEKIPLDDPATFKMLSAGHTHSVFQLNGAAMTRYLMELQPTNIHDINAMVALYRPGPMAFIPDYIERKNDPEKIHYLDPRFESILDRSFGVIVYQDDVLAIALKFAGYNWLEADKFRKAIGKKIPEEMAAQKEKFTTGCRDIGHMDEATIRELWAQIETFAAYGFNKAHAASYGRVAYQTAYMKAHYPVEYMAAVLTADSGDVEKISDIMGECRRLGIPVLPPDINESERQFTTIKQADGTRSIRFGLSSIKNFGDGIASAIIEERQRGGAFTSLEDFLTRVKDRNLNKKSLESLIKAGALDPFGKRSLLLFNLDNLLQYNKEKRSEAGQESLFNLMDEAPAVMQLRLEETTILPKRDILAWEKELLGLYLSGHPLDEWREKIERSGKTISRLLSDETIKKSEKGLPITMVGIIEAANVILTKGGEKMAFLKVADFTDSIEVVVFPSVYENVKDHCELDTCIMIKGKSSLRGDDVSILVESLRAI